MLKLKSGTPEIGGFRLVGLLSKDSQKSESKAAEPAVLHDPWGITSSSVDWPMCSDLSLLDDQTVVNEE